MTFWNLLEWAAWILSIGIACWLLYDAVMTSRRYSEDFLTHTIEDLGDADLSASDGSGEEGTRP